MPVDCSRCCSNASRDAAQSSTATCQEATPRLTSGFKICAPNRVTVSTVQDELDRESTVLRITPLKSALGFRSVNERTAQETNAPPLEEAQRCSTAEFDSARSQHAATTLCAESATVSAALTSRSWLVHGTCDHAS